MAEHPEDLEDVIVQRVLPGTVRRVTRPWAGLALSEEELGSVYVGDEASPPDSSE